jgi:hypothetical protein
MIRTPDINSSIILRSLVSEGLSTPHGPESVCGCDEAIPAALLEPDVALRALTEEEIEDRQGENGEEGVVGPTRARSWLPPH